MKVRGIIRKGKLKCQESITPSGTRFVLWMHRAGFFAFRVCCPDHGFPLACNRSSGAPVAGAKVTATDVDRGAPFSTATNEVGAYNLPRLPVGSYTIRVEHPGFNAAQQTNITLELNQAAHVDIKLTVGDVSTQVNVSDAAPILQTETTQIGNVMESKAIAALPLETRNYNQLALLTPGAITTSPGAFNTGQTTFNAGRPYINGNRE